MDQILFVQSTQPHQPFFQSIKSKQTKPNQIKSINQPINQIKSIQIKSNPSINQYQIKQSINQSINQPPINQIKSNQINQSINQTIKRSNQINQSNDQTINNDDNLNNSQYFGSGTAFLRLVCVACNRLSRRCFANSASSSFRPERNHLVKGGGEIESGETWKNCV
jgi:hypothetical protein